MPLYPVFLFPSFDGIKLAAPLKAWAALGPEHVFLDGHAFLLMSDICQLLNTKRNPQA
jgi:hypothetical protein